VGRHVRRPPRTSHSRRPGLRPGDGRRLRADLGRGGPTKVAEGPVALPGPEPSGEIRYVTTRGP
jgi:hypothetical protein